MFSRAWVSVTPHSSRVAVLRKKRRKREKRRDPRKGTPKEGPQKREKLPKGAAGGKFSKRDLTIFRAPLVTNFTETDPATIDICAIDEEACEKKLQI